MKQEIRTYYYKRFVRVQSDKENVQNLLEQAYKDGTTFVYCPLKVKHTAYENPAVLKACGLFKRREVKEIMETSTQTKSLTPFVGRIAVRLNRTENQQIQKKTLILYYSRLSPSVDLASTAILRLKTLQLEGIEWEIQGCSGGGERVKFQAQKDVRIESGRPEPSAATNN
jgi:hypothetical protein